MPKIYLCTVTQNQERHIDEMTADQSWYDGIVAVDHFSTDNTFNILNARKKDGVILQMPWLNLHYMGMTAVLQSGKIRPGDWVYMLDSQERVIPSFVQNIQERLTEYESQGISTLVWGKPFLFRKTLGMVYNGNPHCFPSPLADKIINVQDESQVVWGKDFLQLGQYMLNKKNRDDTEILHGAKYYFYEISNQTLMFYGQFGENVLNAHENARRNFILSLEEELKIKPTFDIFLEYVKNNINNLNPNLIEYIELEFPLKDAIRMKVLGQTRQQILNKRINWSFKEYLKTGDLEQSNNNYIGLINIYRQKAGLPLEK